MYSAEMPKGIWWGNLWERDHLANPGADGRIILRWIFRKWDWGGMDWTDLSQDRDWLRDLGNAVMNLRVPLKRGEFTKYITN